MKLQELYRIEDSVEEQITDFNEWIQREKKIAKPEKITIESEPGVFIDGWVLRPVDFIQDKKYPAILDIHGAPRLFTVKSSFTRCSIG
jgi:dipeptidyl aminopeptidase/acylaminoacyl peptidase